MTLITKQKLNRWNYPDYKIGKKRLTKTKTKEKKLAEKRKRERRLFLYIKSIELNNNLPASEVWFWNKWREAGMNHRDDKPNVPLLNNFICDVYNKTFKYVIEIDGSFHDSDKQKMKDFIKNNELTQHKLTVFRLPAYNDVLFEQLVKDIKILRMPKKKEFIKKVEIRRAD